MQLVNDAARKNKGHVFNQPQAAARGLVAVLSNEKGF